MKYICIEGNIGAGKTTLLKTIEQRHQVNAIYEQFSENPFLELFYKYPEKHSFPLEMSFLAERFQQLNALLSAPDIFNNTYVADYSFLKCLIFASQTLNEQDFHVFKMFFNILSKQLPKPDYIFYLHDDVSQLRQNIQMRARSFENSIDNTYLQRIELSYKQHLTSASKTHILKIKNYSNYFHRVNEIADAIVIGDIEMITQIIDKKENSF